MTEHGPGADLTRLAEIARAALPAYGFAPDTTLTLLNVSENATYLVRDGDREAVLRVHRLGYHSTAAIRSELAWMDALREEAAVATPVVIPARDGAPIVTAVHPDGRERRDCVLFERLPGTSPPDDRLVEAFEDLGAITARMHVHARGWRRPAGFTRFTWDYDAALGDVARWGRWSDGLGVGPAERRILGRLAQVIRDRLDRFGQSAERFGLVHADMRLANLLVDGDRTYVIDFDDCGFSWYLYDLATALSFIEDDPRVPEMIESWIRGYTTVLPLPAEDRAEIPTFVMLRRLLLVAWIGSHSYVPEARALGADYTKASCELAESYLSRHG